MNIPSEVGYMNKTKIKHISIILSLVIMFTMFSVNVFAYDTNVDVTGIVAPLDGESPAYTATVSGEDFEILTASYGYVINGITWYDLTDDSNMSENDSFIDNHAYKVSILIVPSENGYWSLETATINGEEAEVSEADDCYIISYVFGEVSLYLDNTVNLTVTQPVPGQLPSYEITNDNECFELKTDEDDINIINGVTWYDVTKDCNITAGTPFEEYRTYKVTILLIKAEGCELELLYATVNGENAEISEADDCYLVSFIFGEEPVNEDETAHITIKAPLEGEKPSYSATIDNECFEINNYNEGYVYNGITWFDDTFCTNLDKNDVFLAGHYYTVTLFVEKAEGCELELLRATVNRNDAEFYEIDGYYSVSYQFYIETDAEIITSVNISDISQPKPGQAFDYTATMGGIGYQTVSTSNSTTINGISWYDQTTEKFVKTTETATEGHYYAVVLELEAANGYILLPEIVTINGNKAGFSYTEQNNISIEISFDPYSEPIIREIKLTDINIPVQGDYPDYEAYAHSNKYLFQDKNNTYFCGGIAWFDTTTGMYLEPDNETFVGGHTYMLEIYLVPANGYTFDSPTVLINNEQATQVYSRASQVIINHTFVPCEAPTDITININAIGGQNYYSPKVELINIDTKEVVYEAYAEESSTPDTFCCSFDFVYPTDYIMRVTKYGCAERSYNIIVSSYSYDFSASIFEYGDVNMDTVIDANDYQAAVNYALNGTSASSENAEDEDYQKSLADIYNDGVIDVIDCFYIERKTA